MKRGKTFWIIGGLLLIAGFLSLDLLVVESVSDGFEAESLRKIEAFRISTKEHQIAFLDDARLTASWLPPQKRANDAGPWLNALVPWTDDEPGVVRPLAVTEADKSRFAPIWTDTDPAVFDKEFESLKWLKKAGEFDHWRSVNPVVFTSERRIRNAAIPMYLVFMHWTKLRLLHGKTSDLSVAAAEVRHLAALLLSTETIIGAAVAQRILTLEREATLAFRKEGIEGADAITPVTKPQTEALRRVIHTAYAYFETALGQDVWLRARAALKGTTIYCFSLEQATERIVYVRSLLESYENFGPRAEQLRQASLQNDCYHDVVRALWRLAPKDVEAGVKRLKERGSLGGPDSIARPAQGFSSAEKMQISWALTLYAQELPDVGKTYGPKAP